MAKLLWVMVCLLAIGTQSYFTTVSDWVQSHNSRRCLHGVSDLTWSETVEDSAQTHANNCVFQHASSPYGENLYASSQTNPTNPSDSALQSWYNGEIGSYDYTNPVYSTSTGHFTQVCHQRPHDFSIGDTLTLCGSGCMVRTPCASCHAGGVSPCWAWLALITSFGFVLVVR